MVVPEPGTLGTRPNAGAQGSRGLSAAEHNHVQSRALVRHIQSPWPAKVLLYAFVVVDKPDGVFRR